MNQNELPKGYSLTHDLGYALIFIQKNGSTLRRINNQPIQFGINERDQAVRFAWWHSGEQCPNATEPAN